ncbi:MAG TPA: hypothetical protein PKM36_03550 [Propionibacteriaceae bacterium]|nr:hypothetical protein [Propionibacteriaceae bacterium]HPZ49906.1 hypothetical protein [Propionibacteriaceae bacterium]HQE31328.1 hypothetical protein [Propionibacteriaceae bacterium]
MATATVKAAINLRLAMIGIVNESSEPTLGEELVTPILARQREMGRRLSYRLSAVDGRIQAFLDDYLDGCSVKPQLPRRTLVLDQPGLARDLSLPADGDEFHSKLLASYRLANGVLHNPANDRRTTAGVFHIAEGGLPIDNDKIAVPKESYARLLELAFQPPTDSMVLPFCSAEDDPAACFVSLLLRPIVVPGVPGYMEEKTSEIRFIVPGGMVANLDFVESIFGNGGDPYLPENDASLYPTHWTGHSGLVVLAPHLTGVTKKAVGLPHVSEATERQRRDGVCWESEDEPYNNGQAFKICARDTRGVMVTVIADNYFGYCKKEVKTQISYSANLWGNVEEEHAGGALCFPSDDLGQEFTTTPHTTVTVADIVAGGEGRFELQPEGHAIDTEQGHIVLVPAPARYSLRRKTVSWDDVAIPLRAETTYMSPDGYRVTMAQQRSDRTMWSLVGTLPVSTSCHKPSTVSGGGKSEISKDISDAFVVGNAYVSDFTADMDAVAAVMAYDTSHRFLDGSVDERPILSFRRSMGSVIKLLTPSELFTDDYNAWLESIPVQVKELVFLVKRCYRKDWGDDWRSHFSVGIINGRQGNFLRLDGEKVLINMVRVGFAPDGSWRLFGLRPDFHPAAKVQTEDDITASITVPGNALGQGPDSPSRKVVQNCEKQLFQRPDDAIIRGYDRQAEADIAGPGTFLSNFEPLTVADAHAMVDDAVAFSTFTDPVQKLLTVHAEGLPQAPAYVVSSANPRLVNGKPSKNPRYLQTRPDVRDAEGTAAATLSAQLAKGLPPSVKPVLPVDVVAAGRRNNPPEEGVPALCPFNPLHYFELPELFMEFISSMTGKSPSTTGAGSEGALTKGPFNAMPQIIDLNAAFCSYALTEYDGWISCAGYVGPQVRVAHDISLLVPELFSRMTVRERDVRNLMAEGSLEKVEDFEHEGRTVPASRLGYRITQHFTNAYFGRILMHPHVVFTHEMLQPELQDLQVYVDSIDTIVTTHERVAKAYFEDGTVALAVPPLRALLEIMAYGETADGRTIDDPAVRELFTRESVLASDWYEARLVAKQEGAVRRATNGLAAIEKFVDTPGNEEPSERLNMPERIEFARSELERVSSPDYLAALRGTLGLQPELG